MRKILLLSIFLLIGSFLLPINNVEARRGCCSHHGGVCGCRCCDGTPLSAKCAPYYPHCNSPIITTTTKRIVSPITTTTTTTVPILPKSTEQEIEVPKIKTEANNELETQKSLEPSTSEKLTAQVYKENREISVWWWIIGTGAALSYFIYKLWKKRR